MCPNHVEHFLDANLVSVSSNFFSGHLFWRHDIQHGATFSMARHPAWRDIQYGATFSMARHPAWRDIQLKDSQHDDILHDNTQRDDLT
jgi:hypothetical protein